MSVVRSALPAQKWTAAAIITAATALSTVPAQADIPHDSFITALNEAGVTYGDETIAIALGKAVCPIVEIAGKSFVAVVATVTANGIPPHMAAKFAGLAIKTYCPEAMAKVLSSVGDSAFYPMLASMQ